jgi:hypothetical protein
VTKDQTRTSPIQSITHRDCNQLEGGDLVSLSGYLESTGLDERCKGKKTITRNTPWRPIGSRDVEDPTLSSQSAHRWR